MPDRPAWQACDISSTALMKAMDEQVSLLTILFVIVEDALIDIANYAFWFL